MCDIIERIWVDKSDADAAKAFSNRPKGFDPIDQGDGSVVFRGDIGTALVTANNRDWVHSMNNLSSSMAAGMYLENDDRVMIMVNGYKPALIRFTGPTPETTISLAKLKQ